MMPDLASYDRFLVAFSGGKDSIALLATLLDAGVPRDKIELHHHDVDGGGPTFMDWRCTPAYCRAIADALGIPLYFSHKEGGYLRELSRKDQPTAPISFEVPEGGWRTVGGKGPNGTRGKHPQVSADLSVRWCSPYCKIDVMAALIRNQDRFIGALTCVLTGERAQESAARAKYQTLEPHKSDTRDGTRRARHVDVWRAVHGWDEQRVWDAMREWGIVPHLAYQLGWSRLSCMTCIFGSPNQWATIRHVFPARFELLAASEEASGFTIQRKCSVRELADRGTPYRAALERPDLCALAESDGWSLPILTDDWRLPAGAFGENAGPC